MVHIVTGRMNSGKTTSLLATYLEMQRGEGFVSLKTMLDGKVHHFDLMDLSSGKERRLCLHRDVYQKEFKTPLVHGPYVFDQEVFDMVYQAFQNWISQGETIFFLDEVGILELFGRGFDSTFKLLVSSPAELYVTIREDLWEEVVNKYQMKQYSVKNID